MRACSWCSIISRYLRHRGYRLQYVRNITDIDDKDHPAGAEQGEPMAYSPGFHRAMHEDCAALGILPPDAEPRATQFVPQIIAMVQALLARGECVRRREQRSSCTPWRAPATALSGKRLADLRAGASKWLI
jgi:cysteinyl-tRNA synthetase